MAQRQKYSLNITKTDYFDIRENINTYVKMQIDNQDIEEVLYVQLCVIIENQLNLFKSGKISCMIIKANHYLCQRR